MNPRETDELARLREAFFSGGWEGPGDDCPDTDTLWASAAGELKPSQDEAVLLHLARCAECASVWRLAREMMEPGQAEPAAVLPMAARQPTAWWQRPGLLAAAAAVVIGLGVGMTMLLHQGRGAAPPVYRQQGQAMTIKASPSTRELPRTACRLQWSPGPEGTRYDLTITSEDLNVLATVNGLTVPEYILPAEKIPAQVHEILWRVRAHFPDGVIVSSATFTSRIVE